MIEKMPCGCSTIPIKKFIKVKEKLLAGKAIITDNPEIEESEIVFFQFKDGNVFSVVMFHDDTNATANFDIKRAIESHDIFIERRITYERYTLFSRIA